MEAKPKPQASAAQLSGADDIAGVPPALVANLRSLNEEMRTSHYPLAPAHEIPVKFWKTRDKDIFFDALYYFPAHFSDKLEAQNARRPISGIPEGYLPAFKIFESLRQLDSGNLATAIAGKGPAFYRDVAAIYRKAGFPKLADLYRNALAAYGEDSRDNPSPEFVKIAAAIAKAVNSPVHSGALVKYFSRARLFEQA